MKFINCIIYAGKLAIVLLVSLTLSGCTTVELLVGGIVGGTTAYFSRSPGNEIEQTYYLGAFDPNEQIAPTVYRVRVHGQASSLSFTKFASGWIKSDLIDSLGTNIDFNGQNGGINVDSSGQAALSSLSPEKRLILFGPEGFREAPKDHRLVIVMGSSPESFFKAVDQSLGIISEVKAQTMSEGLSRRLFEALHEMESEQEYLNSLKKDIDAELPESTVGKEGN